jgi:hypothetical protein
MLRDRRSGRLQAAYNLRMVNDLQTTGQIYLKIQLNTAEDRRTGASLNRALHEKITSHYYDCPLRFRPATYSSRRQALPAPRRTTAEWLYPIRKHRCELGCYEDRHSASIGIRPRFCEVDRGCITCARILVENALPDTSRRLTDEAPSLRVMKTLGPGFIGLNEASAHTPQPVGQRHHERLGTHEFDRSLKPAFYAILNVQHFPPFNAIARLRLNFAPTLSPIGSARSLENLRASPYV